MFRVEIKEDKRLNKNVLFRRNHIYHFNDMDEVDDFLNGIRDEYGVISEGEKKFSYLDYKEGCLMKVSIHSCRNTDIPKLKENQVWVKLFSNTPCLREAAIFEFCDLDNKESFIERRMILGNHEAVEMKNLGLTYFMNKFGDVAYAKKLS